MKRNLTTRATLGGTAKMLRGLMGSNASGGQSNSELDKLREVNAELLAALQTLADAAEAQARGDDDATPTHLRCIDSAYMATTIIAARAAIAKAQS